MCEGTQMIVCSPPCPLNKTFEKHFNLTPMVAPFGFWRKFATLSGDIAAISPQNLLVVDFRLLPRCHVQKHYCGCKRGLLCFIPPRRTSSRRRATCDGATAS